MEVLQRMLSDDVGVWVLSSHADATSEFSLTTASPSETADTTIRADRVFRAGSDPGGPGEEFLWIIDYKTSAHSVAGLEIFLQRQREVYAEQLQAYADSLAPVWGVDSQHVRVGLYFPAIPRLLWWSPETK